MPPSLHAGLIERARPRAALQIVREIDQVVEPRPSNALLAALTPVRPKRPPQETMEVLQHERRSRFGLTVRVYAETRCALERLRAETGDTFQQILHRAVLDHIDRR